MSDEVTREEIELSIAFLKDCEDPMAVAPWPVRPGAYLRLAKAYLALLDERDRLRAKAEGPYRQRLSEVGFDDLYEKRLAELRARVEKLEAVLEAAKKLSHEVKGMEAFDAGIRAEMGNTNWRCLHDRLQELLTSIAAAEEKP